MIPSRFKSVTLVELLICMILLGVLILGINNIVVFSTYHHASADRLVRLQNDVSRCLEHITKRAGMAVGNLGISSGNDVVYAGGSELSVFIDSDRNGQRDVWVRYTLNGNALEHYRNCGNGLSPSCPGTCTTANECETLASNIIAFTPSFVTTGIVGDPPANCLGVSLTACWNPAGTCLPPEDPSADPHNPTVNMQTTVILPEVATH